MERLWSMIFLVEGRTSKPRGCNQQSCSPSHARDRGRDGEYRRFQIPPLHQQRHTTVEAYHRRGNRLNSRSPHPVSRPRLRPLIRTGQPLNRRDWRRALIATEIVFASDVFGSGWDWSITTGISDEDTIRILRSLQRKIARPVKIHYRQLPILLANTLDPNPGSSGG
jgi:hypothetical protein